MSYITPELFLFFEELAFNNERAWFEDNKARYQQVVQEPLLAFISDFAPALKAISPHYLAVAKKSGGSLFRIYKDVRFARDGRPYKTQAGVHFRHEAGKDAHAPGFYLHLEPGNVFMGVGLWHPPTPVAAQIRAAMAKEPERWSQARRAVGGAEGFAFHGDSLKRAPAGYDPTHPLIEDLKRKDFIAMRNLTEAQACAPDFLKQFTGHCRQLAPLACFLTEAVGLPFQGAAEG